MRIVIILSLLLSGCTIGGVPAIYNEQGDDTLIDTDVDHNTDTDSTVFPIDGSDTGTVEEMPTFYDVNTGLTWMATASKVVMNYDEAVAYCGNLVAGGYDDWNLPTFQVMFTAIKCDRVRSCTYLRQYDECLEGECAGCSPIGERSGFVVGIDAPDGFYWTAWAGGGESVLSTVAIDSASGRQSYVLPRHHLLTLCYRGVYVP